MNIVIGLFAIALGLIQGYFTKNQFVQLKTHGGASTSYFIGFALWFSVSFAFILILLGLSSIFNWL